MVKLTGAAVGAALPTIGAHALFPGAGDPPPESGKPVEKQAKVEMITEGITDFAEINMRAAVGMSCYILVSRN